MTVRNREFGDSRERKVRDHFRAQEYVVFRPGASLGCADLVALKAGEPPLLIQVKGSRRSAFSDFPPAERLRLSATARVAGAEPLLAWWPPRGRLQLFWEDMWPAAGRAAA